MSCENEFEDIMALEQFDNIPSEILNCPSILEEVFQERKRQFEKWGEQNHPDGTGLGGSRDDADYAQAQCKEFAEDGHCTWELILREEFFEAMAETDPDKLRCELIQLAAVTVQWIQAIDRRARR